MPRVGQIAATANDPAANYKRMQALMRQMDRLRPYAKPRGKLYRFKTYDDLHEFSLTRAARRL
jgi:hypothetical protein